MARPPRGPLLLPSAQSLRIALAIAAVLFVVAAPEARGASPPPEMPPATYEAVEEQTFVRMDDGVRLGGADPSYLLVRSLGRR